MDRELDLTTDRSVDSFLRCLRLGQLQRSHGIARPTRDRAPQRLSLPRERHHRVPLPLRLESAPLLGSGMPRIAGGAGAAPAAAYGQGPASNPATSAAMIVPFDQASKRGYEPGPSYQLSPASAEQQIGTGPLPLPAQGFLRQIEIAVQTITAATGSPVAGADYPFNLLSQVRLQDTGGAQLDDLPGYALCQDNIYGGYAGCPDPRVDPDYSASATAPAFQLMLVRELAPTGFGCLPNMSASQSYKLSMRMGTLAVYTTAPTAAPLLQVAVWMHYWTLPSATDLLGRQQTQQVPYQGTAQYRWWQASNSVSSAVNLTLTQVGNEIRYFLLIGRNSSGARDDGVFPDPMSLRWNSDLLMVVGQRQMRKIMRELTNDLTARDTGVLLIPFNMGEGRFVGGSGVNSLLPTVTSTRLQITGTQPSSDPGTVDVLTNDVSIAETNPALRPTTPSATGYHPPVAPQIVGAT
jgi:hypothetical protein